MRNKIVAGNWKMNCSHFEAMKLASEVAGILRDEMPAASTTVILAPPFVHLYPVAQLLKGNSLVSVAAQNCASETKGAFTGEVSAEMIKSTGADYVIIGHSERRKYFNETNSILKKKTDLALAAGLVPIFCCGETSEERSKENHFAVVQSQLSESLFHLDRNNFNEVVVAYEPVWAIGTGVNATPQQAQEMHSFIRKLIREKYNEAAETVSILYGGSCNATNAKELFSNPDVDGGLIGGASLNAREFVEVVKAA